MSSDTFEVHDPAIPADARAVLAACRSAKEMQNAVIAAVNRWFAGTQYIDEIEALCVELLKKVFRAR